MMAEQTLLVPLELALRVVHLLDYVVMAEGDENSGPDACDMAEQFRALIDARADAIEKGCLASE
jgi:hypothetical protein